LFTLALMEIAEKFRHALVNSRPGAAMLNLRGGTAFQFII
jgi:hypothetical protein